MTKNIGYKVILYIVPKKVRQKSRECHNHKPQPISDTKRKRKQTKPNTRKSIKSTKSTACMAVDPIMLYIFISFLEYTTLSPVKGWMTDSSSVSEGWHLTIDVYPSHYENAPIQIYWKFTTKKGKFSDKKKLWYFFIFLLKTEIVGTR